MNYTEYYEMSEEQFEEMESFYQKLGYDKKQTKTIIMMKINILRPRGMVGHRTCPKCR